MKVQHLTQIDILKGLAIISVIMQHTFNRVFASTWVLTTFSIYYILQAIPIFVILLGLNMGLSFKRRKYSTFKQLYSKPQLLNRIERIVFPFILIFLLTLSIGLLVLAITGKNIMYFGPLTLIGYLPVTGPGNYFVSLIFQFILIFPLIYRFYLSHPKSAIIVCFIINYASLLLLTPLIIHLPNSDFIQSACIFNWIFAIALGLWVSRDLILFSKRNQIVILGALISIIYFSTFYTTSYQDIALYAPRVVSFFYPLFLILVGIKYLPKATKNRFVGGLAHLGIASYHIFLMQIVYFSVFTYATESHLINPAIFSWDPNLPVIVVLRDILVCIALGLLFMHVERKLRVVLKQRIKALFGMLGIKNQSLERPS